MATKMQSLFPRWGEGADYLYLVGCSDGSIKVGRTKDPTSRIRCHRSRLREKFAWAHLFCHKTGGAEMRAMGQLSIAGGHRPTKRGETFLGLSKATALSACRIAIAAHAEEMEKHRLYLLRERIAEKAWTAFKAGLVVA